MIVAFITTKYPTRQTRLLSDGAEYWDGFRDDSSAPDVGPLWRWTAVSWIIVGFGDKQQPGMKELATLFFRLGFTAFGGPAVHIAMMQEEVVTKRKWMTHDHFLDLVGATNLIPGPE